MEFVIIITINLAIIFKSNKWRKLLKEQLIFHLNVILLASLVVLVPSSFEIAIAKLTDSLQLPERICIFFLPAIIWISLAF